MVSSIARSTASGSTAVFSVPFPYLDKAHVQVRLNGVLKTMGADYTFPTDSTIQISAGNPTAGTTVERRRVTPASPLTVFAPGNLDSNDLNVAELQPLYVAGEANDNAIGVLDLAWQSSDGSNGGTIAKGTNGHFAIFDGSGNIVDSGEDGDGGNPVLLGATIHAATSKTTPVDADELSIWNSVGAVLGKVTWANLKATMLSSNLVANTTAAFAYWNTTSDAVPLDADRVYYGDSANSFAPLYGTWTSVKAFLKTYFDGLYVRLATDGALTAGYTATSVDDGTKTTGTYTPSPAGGNYRKINRNGAFAIGAPSATGCYSMTVDVTNGASAGAITYSGWASGHPKNQSALTTTNAAKFKLHINKTDAGVTGNWEGPL